MTNQADGPRTAKARDTASIAVDGGTVHNKILLGLPPKERSTILPDLDFVEIRTHDVLHDAGNPISHGYFINDGLASFLSVMKNGKSVEVGLAGAEGFVGLPLVVGLSTSPTRVVMQVQGSAFRLKRAKLQDVLRRCPQLQRQLNRFTQAMTMQAAQVAACNRVHEVDERLARWLLMSQDRLGGERVPLTQEFLAHMLGTRRASVTVAAGILQRAGLIRYTRGEVNVVDRAGLKMLAANATG